MKKVPANAFAKESKKPNTWNGNNSGPSEKQFGGFGAQGETGGFEVVPKPWEAQEERQPGFRTAVPSEHS